MPPKNLALLVLAGSEDSASAKMGQAREARPTMSVHFIVRFEPLPGKDLAFREELLRVVGPTRAESGCVSIRVFESLHDPLVFAIHSEWADEAAFERHARLPHTIRFLGAAEKLLTHAVEGLRTREIA